MVTSVISSDIITIKTGRRVRQGMFVISDKTGKVNNLFI